MGIIYRLILFSFCIILLISRSTNGEEFTKDHKELLNMIAEVLSSSDDIPKATLQTKREIEADRREKLTRGLEKIIQFVNVLGQVDNFITDRAKIVVRKLNAVVDVDEGIKTRRNRAYLNI